MKPNTLKIEFQLYKLDVSTTGKYKQSSRFKRDSNKKQFLKNKQTDIDWLLLIKILIKLSCGP